MSQNYQYTFSSTGGSSDSGLFGSSGTGAGNPAQYSFTSGNTGGASSAALGGGATQYTFTSGGSGGAGSGAGAGQIATDILAAGLGGGSSLTTISFGGNSASNTTVSYGSGGASAGGFSVSGGATSASLAAAFSEIEQAILRATNPITINETEEITVIGERGIWANKREIEAWRGEIPITQYIINEDPNPEIIRKRVDQALIYEQEIAIRYLRPPTPPPPGEILIRQEKNTLTPPAPPLVIRQQPPRPETPAPLVIREAPPKPPAAVGSKVVTISGKRLPPPPRKVVIERLAPLPSKPQAIMIERWLPYAQSKRRVIFQRSTEADPIIPKPRNVIVQWEAPAVTIKKEFKDLGVIRANPVEYVQKYGATLKTDVELPSFVKEIRPPSGVVLAAEYSAPSVYELEGDVQALTLIDLDREGLAEYRTIVSRFGGSAASFGGSSVTTSYGGGASYGQSSTTTTTIVSGVSGNSSANAIIAEIFASADRNADGRLSLSEAERLLLRLNSRLGRNYGEEDVRNFFRAVDVNRDGYLSFEEFRQAVIRAFVF